MTKARKSKKTTLKKPPKQRKKTASKDVKPLPDPSEPLKNASHERFCWLYLEHGRNGAEAYRAVGYKAKDAEKAAYNLLKRPEVDARIKYLEEKRGEETGVSVKWALIKLKQLVERCMQAEAVYDKEGNPTGEYRFDSTGANSALDKIMKNKGGYKEDNSQKPSNTVNILDVENLTDEQLQQIVSQES